MHQVLTKMVEDRKRKVLTLKRWKIRTKRSVSVPHVKANMFTWEVGEVHTLE